MRGGRCSSVRENQKHTAGWPVWSSWDGSLCMSNVVVRRYLYMNGMWLKGNGE